MRIYTYTSGTHACIQTVYYTTCVPYNRDCVNIPDMAVVVGKPLEVGTQAAGPQAPW